MLLFTPSDDKIRMQSLHVTDIIVVSCNLFLQISHFLLGHCLLLALSKNIILRFMNQRQSYRR